MAYSSVVWRDSCAWKRVSASVCLLFFSFGFFFCSFYPTLICSVFVFSHFILLYYYPLGACLFSKKRQKEGGCRERGSREGLGGETYTSEYSVQKNVFNKEKVERRRVGKGRRRGWKGTESPRESGIWASWAGLQKSPESKRQIGWTHWGSEHPPPKVLVHTRPPSSSYGIMGREGTSFFQLVGVPQTWNLGT